MRPPTLPIVLLLSLAACTPGAGATPGAPPRVPSLAELALLGPERAAEHLSGLSLDFDAARVSAALVAADTCPAADEACRTERKRQALESFAAAGGALETILAVEREVAGPHVAPAIGPDEAAVCKRLRLVCPPTPAAAAP